MRLRLPSGRELSYVKPMVVNDDITYEGTVQKTNRWGRIESYGPKLVENIVQAVARDCLAVTMMKVEALGYPIEPCCGEGHISRELQKLGYDVESSDIIYRGFGKEGEFDFLDSVPEDLQGSDIVTNPPYNQAARFIEHAIDCTDANAKIAMLLRLTFLESKKRKRLFDTYPPTAVYVFRNRIGCAKNGEFKINSHGELYYPSAVAYAWFLWDKSQFKFAGSPPKLFWLD